MITSARIDALRKLNDDPDTATEFGWITALRAPAIAKLARADGPLQMSLFDTQDLAEISHPDYPGERLIACRNPALAAERARKRRDLLAATDKLLAGVADRVTRGTLTGDGEIGKAVGKVIDKHTMGKHFHTTITDTTLTYRRDQARIDAEAHLDGIYVLRTSVDADTLDPAGIVESYKNLANIERDFRIIKTDDLDLRPIHHRLDDRVKAHVLICLLACYLVWHLRKAWAPMTFTDEHPPNRDNPVAPAQRSATADAKARTQRDESGNPLRSFRGLLDHLATLTRNQVRRRRRHRRADPHPGNPRPAPRLPPHRRPDPPHRHVARNIPPQTNESPAQLGIRPSHATQLGPSRARPARRGRAAGVCDGAKALSATTVREVFGAKVLIQRCTLHYADPRIMPMWPQKLLCA